MKRIPLVCAIMFLLSFPAGDGAMAFWCGSKLVSIGDSKAEVLHKCGEPAWKDERTDYVYEPSLTGSGVWMYIAVPVIVDEWTYNLGPQQFMRTLRFQNGKVAEVRTGDYGH